MSISRLALMGAAGAGGGIAVEDAFSTDLYTGNGSTQTITNGIDLAGEGGLVWTKRRDSAGDHILVDSAQGVDNWFRISTGMAFTSVGRATFSPSGFAHNTTDSRLNSSGGTYVAWTFRKAQKFFDAVTWTGDGVAGRDIPHNLGIEPGLIIVKRRNGASSWYVWHRDFPDTDTIFLEETTASGNNAPYFDDTAPTDSVFSVGPAANTSGYTYVAYLFAHNDADDGIIQCGSYTGNGSATGPTITLGWEPQYVLFKRSDGESNWYLFDAARSGANSLKVDRNLSEVVGSNIIDFLSTGFQIKSSSTIYNASGGTYIYMAIRAEGT
jgi:hypothetical protein